MGLGDIDAIKRSLAATATTFDSNQEQRLIELEDAISTLVAFQLGRTFGSPVANTTVLVYGTESDILLLLQPARSIASVTVGGTWDGTVWTGGTVHDSDLWQPHFIDTDGSFLALRLVSGGWWGWRNPVLIVGDFSTTDDDAEVPPDLVLAVNTLVVESFKNQNLSPVTDDGTVVPRRDPWKDPFVAQVIERYRINQWQVAV